MALTDSSLQENTTALLGVSTLSPTIGAEISGINLAEPLAPAIVAQLRSLLLEHKVLFFRDQPMNSDQHLAFARQFGELEVHPFAPHKENYPELLAITHDRERPGRENNWHSDVTWRREPSLGSILRAIELPAVGGDTLFADMYAAYENLSDKMQHFLSGLTAVHDWKNFRRRLRRKGVDETEIARLREVYPIVEHPVIRTHPETGRKGIYVNAGFTIGIKDMSQAESEPLLKHLYHQAWRPEVQCRFRWTENALAFWDNRSTQHYAVSDYWPHRRVMERATIVGDRPV